MRTTIRVVATGLVLVALVAFAQAQNWRQDDSVFNPSGIPSLPFSQPRLADLDNDHDFDLILGSTDGAPLYFANVGTATNPDFAQGADIFAPVDPLDAEMGVCADLDDDGDLDLVTGGYRGLVYFENAGTATSPAFTRRDGFFAGLSPGSNPIPTLADLDGDSDFDLVIGRSESGEIKFYRNVGTPSAAQYSESQASVWFDIGLYAYPWLADLDGDLDIDLSAGRDAPGFVYYRNDGDVHAWSWTPVPTLFEGLGESTYWNSPCLIDLNGDSRPDLIYGTAAGPLQYYLNEGPPADPVWTLNTTLFGGVLDVGGASSPVFFDFDVDGDLDLVCGTQIGDIKYYENVGSASSPAWEADHSYFASIDHSIYSAIALGDLDGDSLPDAVVGDLSGNLFYHRNTGTGFEYDPSVFSGIGVGGWSVPRLVDMDGDSDLDLVVGNEAGRLTYVENIGGGQMDWEIVSGYFGSIDVGSDCSPALGDFDGDGDPDVITGDISHELQYFENRAGSWVEDPSIVAGLVVGQNAAPAFGDLDGDHDLDLAVGNYSGTFNYFVNENPTAGASEEAAVCAPTFLRAYPNPFGERVSLVFGLPQAAQVDLWIFDVQGREICRLLSDRWPAGEHAIEWNRAMLAAAQMGGGIYFCRLRAGGEERSLVLRCVR